MITRSLLSLLSSTPLPLYPPITPGLTLAYLKLDDKPLQVQDEIATIFKEYDADRSGQIDQAELLRAIKEAPGCGNVDDKSVVELLKEGDKDGDMKLDVDEFRALVATLSVRSNLSSASAAFVEAVAIERSRLGELASQQAAAFKLAVPAILGAAAGACLFASLTDEKGFGAVVGATLFGPDKWPVRVSAAAAVAATAVIGKLVKEHVDEPNDDGSSVLVIAIVAMVPLYAWASALKIMLPPDYTTYRSVLEAVKECYEAVVLHDFLALMYIFAGVRADAPIPKAMKGRHVHFGPPVDWFWKDAHFDGALVKTLEAWTLQYTLVQPVLAAVHIGLHGFLHHRPALGTFVGYTSNAVCEFILFSYFYFIRSFVYATLPSFLTTLPSAIQPTDVVSTTLSLSALIGFYHTFEKEIEEHAPLAKLLCVKGVVGLCFYQSIGVPFLKDWIGYEGDGLTDLLIAVEMGFIFAFLFSKSYSKKKPSFAEAAAAAEEIVGKNTEAKKND
jgi:hypothetical protein